MERGSGVDFSREDEARQVQSDLSCILRTSVCGRGRGRDSVCYGF